LQPPWKQPPILLSKLLNLSTINADDPRMISDDRGWIRHKDEESIEVLGHMLL
jgi:hypothetical protein